MSELKPCPFCGEEAEMDCGNSIICTAKCGGQLILDECSDDEEGESLLAEKWNRRALPAAPLAARHAQTLADLILRSCNIDELTVAEQAGYQWLIASAPPAKQP